MKAPFNLPFAPCVDSSSRRGLLKQIAGVAVATMAPGAVLAQAGTVSQFSPQGTVNKARQVRATFSEPAVKAGDPREMDHLSRPRGPQQCSHPEQELLRRMVVAREPVLRTLKTAA